MIVLHSHELLSCKCDSPELILVGVTCAIGFCFLQGLIFDAFALSSLLLTTKSFLLSLQSLLLALLSQCNAVIFVKNSKFQCKFCNQRYPKAFRFVFPVAVLWKYTTASSAASGSENNFKCKLRV